MRRVGKSKSALVALLVTAIAFVATPATAPAQGPDEYQLNLPDGGSGETDTGGGGGGESEPELAAPVPTAPVPTEVPIEPIEPVIEGGPQKPKPDTPEPVLGSTSPNATLGAQRIPTLKVRAGDTGRPLVPLGLAGLAGACCLVGAWRLRYRHELPTAPPPPHRPREAPAGAARVRVQREVSAAARVRGARPPVSKTAAARRSGTRGAASS